MQGHQPGTGRTGSHRRASVQDEPRCPLFRFASGRLPLGALLDVTKFSITSREMYEPGIGARLRGDDEILGFILVVINSLSLSSLFLSGFIVSASSQTGTTSDLISGNPSGDS